ncbi:MAG TPA: hypothetical protein ENH82_04075 [bacterium]|nr:hypothetical protein [bacterium]
MRYTKAEKQMLAFCLFGFEVGSGWFPLIYRALNRLSEHQKSSGDLIRLRQVKEKWGVLRIYIDGPDIAKVIVSKAAEKSTYVCEVCGRPGELRMNDWYSTHCHDHYNGIRVDLEPLILDMLQEADTV